MSKKAKTRWQRIKHLYGLYTCYHPLMLRGDDNIAPRMVNHCALNLYRLMRTYKDEKRGYIGFTNGYVKCFSCDAGNALTICYKGKDDEEIVHTHIFVDEDSLL